MYYNNSRRSYSSSSNKSNGKSYYHGSNYSGRTYDGDNENPTTFRGERKFYYINFVGANGNYDSSHSIRIEGDLQYAKNKAQWYVRNSWALSEIDYWVKTVQVYDSHRGYVCEYEV